MNTTLLDHALRYAEEGIRVFPIQPRGKTPLIKGNLTKATTDPEQIREWWEKWPDANIGIVAGEGLAVLDLDGAKGAKSYKALVAENGPIKSRAAHTPNGFHIWLKDDPENPLPQSAGLIAPGIDTRAGGKGYVVAPPSVRDDGEYAWLNETPMAPVPDWLRTTRERKNLTNAQELVRFSEGERNSLLASIAGKLRDQGFSKPAIEQAILAENEERCVPPLPEDEVRQIARSVSRYEPSPVRDAFKPPPQSEFTRVEEGHEVTEYEHALSLVAALGKAEDAKFLNLLDRAHHAVEALEVTRERAHASALLHRRVKERGLPLSIFNGRKVEGPSVLSLSDLMKRPELLEAPRYVVPRMAYRGRATLFAGADKSGKSTMAAYAIRAVTRGEPFLGEEVDEGRVLIVAPDESTADTVRRLAELEVKPGNVQVMTWHGPSLMEDVQRTIDTWEPTLILFDSLQAVARIVVGEAPKSGDASAWSEVIRPMVDLAHDNDVSVWILHHVAKGSGEARDSTEITAAVDGTMVLRGPGEMEDRRIRHISGRARWTVEPFTVRLDEGGYVIADGRPLTDGERVLRYVIENPGCSLSKLRAGTTIGNERCREVLDSLEEAGRIENRGSEGRTAWYSRDAVADFEEGTVSHGDREEDDGTV